MIKYSVIVPIYNEQDSIEELHGSLSLAMRSLGSSFEIIYVNDASCDHSADILMKISSMPETIVVNLGSHLGKSAALQAGFEHSRGAIIITIDADLQCEPADIQLLLNKKNEGFDVVCGWRHKRCYPCSKIIASNIANYIRRLVFKETIHDVGCSFRVYSRDAFGALNLYRERHRFITAILKKKGFSLGEVKVSHYPRRFGASKYGIIDRLFSSIPDFFAIMLKK
jgi:dolichol-phosphate mannosyltransferase